MRIFVYLYYLFFILSGGFWHYSFCFWYYLNSNVQSTSSRYLEWFFNKIEITLFLVAFVLLFKPLQPKFHLLFFILLLTLDIYFQNYIKYESSIILTNFTPLLFYFFISEKFTKYHNEITYGAILFIAVGFVSSFYRKVDSGWLNWNDTIIHDYIIQFNKGFVFDTFLGKEIVTVENHKFWKLLDYLVLLYEVSFLLLFHKRKYFILLSVCSIFFHLLVFFTLRLGAFFPYILLYTLLISKLNSFEFNESNLKITFILNILFSLLLIFFIFSNFNVQFFYEYSSKWVYIYAEYLFNSIIIYLYIFLFYKVYYSREYKFN